MPTLPPGSGCAIKSVEFFILYGGTWNLRLSVWKVLLIIVSVQLFLVVIQTLSRQYLALLAGAFDVAILYYLFRPEVTAAVGRGHQFVSRGP